MAEVWSLPLGVDFARGFAAGLLARHADRPPEALARVTVFANSQRMRSRIHAALIEQGAGLLPRLRLVSDLESDPILADLPAAAPALRRRLQLNQFIRALIEREPHIAPVSAVQGLTESLFALMEEMDSEGVEPERLAALDVSEHSAHWARSQSFLNILLPFFQRGAPRSAGARQRIAARRLAELWAAVPPHDPVVVAGSTASRGAISVFMEAVAQLPNGAVVLPGFDRDLPGSVWAAMDDALTFEDHPQFRFRRLLDRLGLDPAEVKSWAQATPVDGRRNAVLSLALRPAPVTDQWLTDGAGLTDLPGAMARVTLLEAGSPREEAQAIALMLRQAQAEGRRAALITPDRLLARRVTAALDRWRLRPDDSAGRPLVLSAPGRFLRQVADLACERLTASRLLILLKHPLMMSGGDRGPHLLWTRELELTLRRHGPVFPATEDILRFAGGRDDPAAMPWADGLCRALPEADPAQARLALSDHVLRHRQRAEALARGLAETGSGTLWMEPAGEACREIFARLETEAEHGGTVTAAEYRDLFAALLAEGAVADTVPAHAEIQILGAREARECGADLVILAGLNEGSWPALPAPDPWLNRAMRKEAGLLLPERQIGLSAHDFQQAAAAPEVLFSRALRSDDAETVASRWLNRLVNLLGGLPGADGPRALVEMRARGQGWVRMARGLDLPGATERSDPGLRPAGRPRPVPPVSARPERLSLTEIETLIRDPYAVYARRILSLRPLDKLNAEPDAGDRGTLFHRVLEHFVRQRPAVEDLSAAKARLLSTAALILGRDMPFPVHRALWLARIEASADPLLAEDRRAGETLAVELKGELAIGATGVVMQGRLDRADRRADGKLVLIDYKTGHLPSATEQKIFAKQLLATAVLAERGAFALPAPVEVAEIRYVGISEAGKVVATPITEALKSETWTGLEALLAHYRRRGTGFTARRALMKGEQLTDYDHLSRFGEWDLSDTATSTPVGDADAE